MIDSAHEKDARQEAETDQAGASARSVQRRAKESVGGETEEKIDQKILIAVLEFSDRISRLCSRP